MSRQNLVHLTLVLIFFCLAPPNFAGEIEFYLGRFDYQTLTPKHLYHFSQPLQISQAEMGEVQFGDIFASYRGAMDFGGTTMRALTTGDTIYNGTTVWNGSGEHLFPPSALEIPIPVSRVVFTPQRIDLLPWFLDEADSTKFRRLLEIVTHAWLPEPPQSRSIGLLIHLHYYSVGISDPTTAEWIVVAYTMPSIPEGSVHHWQNISHNLGRPEVTQIGPHSMLTDSLFLGTSRGLFSLDFPRKQWFPVLPDSVLISALDNRANPFVMGPLAEDILFAGTTEFSAIPEARNGRILTSFNSGRTWKDTQFSNIAVTAVTINPLNPANAFAAAQNPFYNTGGLYRYNPNSGWQQIGFPPEISTPEKLDFRINSITIAPNDTNQIYLGTEQGIYWSRDGGKRWENALSQFNIISVVLPGDSVIYAATSGNTRSDGIYISRDFGKNWEVFHWMINLKAFIPTLPFASDMWNLYVAADNRGVFAGDYAGRFLEEITGNLPKTGFTALALDARNPHGIYLGMTDGIFRYQPNLLRTDLEIQPEDIHFRPEQPESNEIIHFFVAIQNNSPWPVANVDWQFRVNDFNETPILIKNLTIPEIPAQQEVKTEVTWLPDGKSGRFRVRAVVDPFNTIRETNEQNNTGMRELTVDPAPSHRVWQDISHNLAGFSVQDIAPHPFDPGQLYAGTNAGAWWLRELKTPWKMLEFSDSKEINVTQICAEPHPFLDWTVPTLYVGTEAYSDIPEDRLGRIFRSENGGETWRDLHAPNLAVTALHADPEFAFTAFAGIWNPFYYVDGFAALHDTIWQVTDLTPDDNFALRINCIAQQKRPVQQIFLGTNDGLYRLNPASSFWERVFGFNIVGIVLNADSIFVATGGRSKSDGIYLSADGGTTWQVVHWHTEVVDFVGSPRAGIFYLASNFDGIFESRNQARDWHKISDKSISGKFNCLARSRHSPEILFTGTEKGIFMYAPPATNISASPGAAPVPATFQLSQNYPNPFNQQTVIEYHVPKNLPVKITILNILGQEIRRLVEKRHEAGNYRIRWDGVAQDGRTVESGVYLVRAEVGAMTQTRKIVFMK